MGRLRQQKWYSQASSYEKLYRETEGKCEDWCERQMGVIQMRIISGKAHFES